MPRGGSFSSNVRMQKPLVSGFGKRHYHEPLRQRGIMARANGAL